MSTTKCPMLSWTHAIFQGLQDSLADSLWSLLSNTPSPLQWGLLKAHCKLSDYYGKSDESLYYTWASHKYHVPFSQTIPLTIFVVLDLWISYSGLLADCGDDLEACSHLEATKTHLHDHFHAKYNQTPSVPIDSIALTSTTNASPLKVDFTSHYQNLPQAFMDEVQEYFKLPHENFDTCDPLRWWAGCCSQFPNLSWFARDVLLIPG